MESVAQFVDPTWVMFAKLILAVLLGGVIGTERALMAHQSAGTRTFGLVALGACLFVVTGSYVDTAFLGIFTGMWYLENRFKHWFTERTAEEHVGENKNL